MATSMTRNNLLPVPTGQERMTLEDIHSAVSVENYTLGASRVRASVAPDLSGSRRPGERSLGNKPGFIHEAEGIQAACDAFARYAPGRVTVDIVPWDVKAEVFLLNVPAENVQVDGRRMAEGFFGKTDMSIGLRKCQELLSILSNTEESSTAPLCILLSDGGWNVGEDPVPLAYAMKQNGIYIASIYYPGPYDFPGKLAKNRKVMEEIASPEMFFPAEAMDQLTSVMKEMAVTVTQTFVR